MAADAATLPVRARGSSAGGGVAGDERIGIRAEPRDVEEFWACFPRLVRFCARQCGDDDLAQDLAQETLIRALRFGTNRPDEPVWPWLRAIARNVVRDHARRRSSGEIPMDPHTAVDRPQEPAVTGEVEVHLSTALARLTPLQRTAMVLRYAEDWTIEDTATFLGMQRNSADQLLLRARRRLRKEYLRVQEAGRGCLAALAPLQARVRSAFDWLTGVTPGPMAALAPLLPPAEALLLGAATVVAVGLGDAVAASRADTPAVAAGVEVVVAPAALVTRPASTAPSMASAADHDPATSPPRRATQLDVHTPPAAGTTVGTASTGTASDDTVSIEVRESVRVGERETGGRTWVEIDCRSIVGGAVCAGYEVVTDTLPPDDQGAGTVTRTP